MAGIQIEIDAARSRFKANEVALTALLTGPHGPVAADLARRAIRVESAAKNYASGRGGGPNVRTGRLRGSITWALGHDTEGLFADIGSAVTYCVFGSHAIVTVEGGGRRTIGQIRPGERVLTQAGDFQRVLAKSEFPAIEKPDLVDLAVPWRKGRDHHLTLTVDHKVLCHREGRNQWIAAGDLRDGDLLFDRVKLAHNEGTGPLKTCQQCGQRHRRQGRRYCSIRCRDAAWAAGGNPHLGKAKSAETREKIREKAVARNAGLVINRRLAERGFRTAHERQVEEWLIARGVPFEMQVAIGGHSVDFFLPETGEIFEADGAYWHRDQDRDVERDKELAAALPGVEITHLHFYDKRFSPERLDPEPLPGVRYIACNPGPESFIDPVQFQMKPVRIERHWRYGVARRPKASLRAMLYDISVENVQSFLANGLIISNSVYVEMGTSRAPAKPYLRPALEAAKTI